ncbi:hypothetical protein A2W70_04785 [Candidatus Curtissbacteria bacterium RIFCSPLOWO2_02_41_11]|uniref:Uncharacterized protein n=1 Tax=Candidatus Curtissbacteria bacterium RIFCSPLOWO2_02_41_11 TaxID=1797731 RepID=A0A1F5HRH2_9BACT|nr:MAG: hypothetical protein A2W70_04785 [Candidatus Curtissbacteria bacterium RIFCSPLOWO2_02_41_11]
MFGATRVAHNIGSSIPKLARYFMEPTASSIPSFSVKNGGLIIRNVSGLYPFSPNNRTALSKAAFVHVEFTASSRTKSLDDCKPIATASSFCPRSSFASSTFSGVMNCGSDSTTSIDALLSPTLL